MISHKSIVYIRRHTQFSYNSISMVSLLMCFRDRETRTISLPDTLPITPSGNPSKAIGLDGNYQIMMVWKSIQPAAWTCWSSDASLLNKSTQSLTNLNFKKVLSLKHRRVQYINFWHPEDFNFILRIMLGCRVRRSAVFFFFLRKSHILNSLKLYTKVFVSYKKYCSWRT